MMWQTTKRSTRPTPRGLVCAHITGRPATSSNLLFAEGQYDPTGRWRG